jgi:hypothetical protein
MSGLDILADLDESSEAVTTMVEEETLESQVTVVPSPPAPVIAIKRRGRKSLTGKIGNSPRLGLSITDELNNLINQESKEKNETVSITVRRILSSYFSL